MAIKYANERRVSLIVRRGRSEAGIACINCRAVRRESVRKRRSTVILQRTEQRIGIDLIAWAIQITAAIIAAKIVSMRSDGAAAVEDVFA